MRYSKLKYSNKDYYTEEEITKILIENNLDWLIESEIRNADIEIKNKTIIWNNGNFIFGFWKYGIFKSGVFNGIWENGIFEKGEFNGEWKSGINLLKHQS
jgi:hypothetical protein